MTERREIRTDSRSDSGDDGLRYGAFLVPDARTSAAVTDITGYVRAQFGLVSAGRFPPHVTLAGSLPLAVSEAELLTVVAAVAARHDPIDVVNHGLARLTSALVFDVHHGHDGRPNAPLIDLAVAINESVRGLLRPTTALPADLHDRSSWIGHLSLASHELGDRPEWRDEVEDFITDLGIAPPSAFRATRIAVYRLHHPDWSPGWWKGFTWELIRSFPLDRARATVA